MADHKVHEAPETDPLVKAHKFWLKFQKPIIAAAVTIAVVVGGWYGYENMVVKPKELRAEDAIFKAQQYFSIDSLNLALNGDGVNKGFLYVLKNYSGTKTANLANYYAGVCYLRTGDFNKAIEYLKKFTTDAKQVQMMDYGCLGDAYSELQQNETAVDYYKKAAAEFESDQTNASEYLFRAALLEETLGKNKEAIDLYKEIKDKFPKSQRAYIADKYIYRLSVQPNDFSVK